MPRPAASSYSLTVIQQPEVARCCGFGEKLEKRAIDPPPVVQLVLHEPDGRLITRPSELAERVKSFVMYVELWTSQDPNDTASASNPPANPTPEAISNTNAHSHSRSHPHPHVHTQPRSAPNPNPNPNPSPSPHSSNPSPNMDFHINPSPIVNPNPSPAPDSYPNSNSSWSIKVESDMVQEAERPSAGPCTSVTRTIPTALCGKCIAHSEFLIKDDGEAAVLFIFPEINIRVKGKYRLKFILFDCSIDFEMPFRYEVVSMP
ncbi:velvet factor [Polychytrium aggregatum]|uniref:velvet factor n=1 Tax=Polychytrium aggregatum TaxID=110093 RepID=UPI0022FF189D|nr:velvet factor [Polychytrium aggregatum]KAI9209292.1 velvet factor [Polychytrium aggregatum]